MTRRSFVPLSHERVREALEYDAGTGAMTWRVGRFAGKRAGGEKPGAHGYRYVYLDGVNYREHRLIWFWVHGRWPPRDVDHRDLRRSNNRLDNLRESDETGNRANVKPSRRNSSGRKGVHWHAGAAKWNAKITAKGKTEHLGLFDDLDAAAAAYDARARELFGEFARLNNPGG
jgi:hypothetical protein